MKVGGKKTETALEQNRTKLNEKFFDSSGKSNDNNLANSFDSLNTVVYTVPHICTNVNCRCLGCKIVSVSYHWQKPTYPYPQLFLLLICRHQILMNSQQSPTCLTSWSITVPAIRHVWIAFKRLVDNWEDQVKKPEEQQQQQQISFTKRSYTFCCWIN